MEKLNWGILGPGIIANQFAHDFTWVEQAKLMAVASRNVKKAKHFAVKYNIPKAYGSYDELYQDQNIDVIYIATPHTFHLKQSLKAIENGKSVLCEKPITTSPEELEILLASAKKHNCYLVEGMWTYFLPAISRARQWVEEGRIGEVYHIKADFGYPVPYDPNGRMYNPQLAGGCLLDMGIYTIAMTRLFFEQDPIHINTIKRNAPSGVDDDVHMQFEYPNSTASLTTSFRCKLHNWAFIIGSKGYVAIPDFWRARECLLYIGEAIQEHFIDHRKGNGFEYEIKVVSKEILANKLESNVMPHVDSQALQRIMKTVKSQFNF